MKERKVGRIIILVAFVMLLCMPCIIWKLAGDMFDSSNNENRYLAEKPVFSVEDYKLYSARYTSYFNDHIPFRNYLISFNSAIEYYCLHNSANRSVIIGKDGWLFYGGEEEDDPISCYRADSLYTEAELEEIANHCMEQRDIVEDMGKVFVIFIAPDKTRIYPEYMPDKYGTPAENYRLLQVYNYLKENTDIRIVYPYAELMDAKGKTEEAIWYKGDTHWNHIGGYVGASALLTELGIDMPKVYSDDITISYDGECSGDLVNMLNLGKDPQLKDDEYGIIGYDSNDVEKVEWDFFEMIRYHATGADPRIIYIIRDSFSSCMSPYIGSQFTDTYLRYDGTYTFDDLLEIDPDIVVYQTIERYLYKLGTFSIQ